MVYGDKYMLQSQDLRDTHPVFSLFSLGLCLFMVFVDIDRLVCGVRIHRRIRLLFAAGLIYGRSTIRAAAPGGGHDRRVAVWCRLCVVCERIFVCAVVAVVGIRVYSEQAQLRSYTLSHNCINYRVPLGGRDDARLRFAYTRHERKERRIHYRLYSWKPFFHKFT